VASVTVVPKGFRLGVDILLTTFGVEKDEVVSEVATKGVAKHLMGAALGDILVKVDAVTAQLAFPVDGVGNAVGDGLFCHQLFQRIQLMISIDERLLELGLIGDNTGSVIGCIIHFGKGVGGIMDRFRYGTIVQIK